MTTAKILFVAFVAATSCSASGLGQSSDASDPIISPAPVPADQPSGMPDLCSFPAGYCQPCGGSALPPCPQGLSGPLCCNNGACVVWSGSHCSGDLGWCFNYTTSTSETGLVVATCHDDQEDD